MTPSTQSPGEGELIARPDDIGVVRDWLAIAREMPVRACQVLRYPPICMSEIEAIERLTAAHRSDRIGTHGVGCHTWGPQHYECAMREIERLSERLARMEEGEVLMGAALDDLESALLPGTMGTAWRLHPSYSMLNLTTAQDYRRQSRLSRQDPKEGG